MWSRNLIKEAGSWATGKQKKKKWSSCVNIAPWRRVKCVEINLHALWTSVRGLNIYKLVCLPGTKLTPCNSYRDLFRCIRKIAGATVSFIMPVCLPVRPSALNNSVPTGRIFMKIETWLIFENLSRKIVLLKSDKSNGYFMWRPMYTYDTMYVWILTRTWST